jgi:hypothetical protein
VNKIRIRRGCHAQRSQQPIEASESALWWIG